MPLVAVGLFYDQGYFKQHLDGGGYQQEEYQDTRVENLPMEPAIGADGKQVTISIETRDGNLMAKVWLMQGRPRVIVLARLRCGREQSAGPRSDIAFVWRRYADADSPGIGAWRRGRQGAAGAGHHAGRVSSQ